VATRIWLSVCGPVGEETPLGLLRCDNAVPRSLRDQPKECITAGMGSLTRQYASTTFKPRVLKCWGVLRRSARQCDQLFCHTLGT